MSEQTEVLAIHVNEDFEMLCRNGEWRQVTDIHQVRNGVWIECGEGFSEYYDIGETVMIR